VLSTIKDQFVRFAFGVIYEQISVEEKR